jgi:hypothetical protein
MSGQDNFSLSCTLINILQLSLSQKAASGNFETFYCESRTENFIYLLRAAHFFNSNLNLNFCAANSCFLLISPRTDLRSILRKFPSRQMRMTPENVCKSKCFAEKSTSLLKNLETALFLSIAIKLIKFHQINIHSDVNLFANL